MEFEIAELQRLLSAVRKVLRSNPKYSFVNKSPIIGIQQNEDNTFKTNGICWLHNGDLISLQEREITFESLSDSTRPQVIYEFEDWNSLIQAVESGNYDSVQ